MTRAETQALRRVAGILLASSIVRIAHEARPLKPVVPADRESILPELTAASESLRVEADRRAKPLAPGEHVDPNEASEVELDRLPGVGPATARAIVAAREGGTVFRNVADLSLVPGIGATTVARLAGHIGIANGAARSTPVVGRVASDPSPPADSMVDLNRATDEDLQALVGIGPALAARILALRAERGGFNSVDDLLEVRGIGEATLERLRASLRVGR